MPDRRGKKASIEELLPRDRIAWARQTWADREDVAKLPSGPWMLREAAKVLGLPDEAVDNAIKHEARRSG